MWLSFQNPWALSLLPLAAVPWILHLIKRRHFRRVLFPSLMLFQEQRVFLWRRSQVEEWLLLICRTLLILATIMALASPVVQARLPGWLSSSREHVVVIIDDSASMAAGREGETPLDSARIKVASYLKGLGPSSKVAVISGSRGHRLYSGFGSPGQAIKVLTEIQTTDLGTDLNPAISLADRMLTGRSSPGILLASDLQRSAFGDSGAPWERLASGARLTIIPLGRKGMGPNLVWRKVEASDIMRRLTLEAELSAKERTSPAPWTIALNRGSKSLMRLTATPAEDGRIATGMELPEDDSLYLLSQVDALLADNRYYLAGSRRSAKNCLVLCQPAGTEYHLLSKALAAFSGIGYRSIFTLHPTPKDLKQADLVIVALEKIEEDFIKSLVQSRGPTRGLMLIPPLRADPASYNRLLSGIGARSRFGDLMTGEMSFRLTIAREKFLGQATVHQVRVQKYWRISSDVPAEIMVAGRDPGLIMERIRICPVALLGFGLDPGMSDIAYRPAFLVMLHRLLEFASEAVTRRQFFAGDSLKIDSRLEPRLIGPEGTVEGNRGGEEISWPLTKAGWYRLLLANGEILLAANIPPLESELEPLGEKAMEKIFGHLSWSYLKAGQDFPAGWHPAWRFFIILALLFFGVESWLRIRILGPKKQLTSSDNYGKNIG